MSPRKIEVVSSPDLKKARGRLQGRYIDRDKIVYPASLKAYEGKYFHIKTYGCQGNVRDSETMAGMLREMGMLETDDPLKASVVIVNTCAVRENAEEKVYGEIGKYKQSHYADKDFALVIAGCMMQEESQGQELLSRYPQVSAVMGTHNIASLPLLLAKHLETGKRYLDVVSGPGGLKEGLPVSRNDPYKAYVDISYGCDKFCTYCIVPYTRGRERSRDRDDILKECWELYREGYQEVTLLGQNVNSYGKDLGMERGFEDLLRAVSAIGFPRIRFLTNHPYDFSDSLIDAIASLSNVTKWIHLPLQSGSSSLLRKMARRYDKDSYLQLVGKIRERIKGVSLSTDIIVGFPGETEEDFGDTLDVVRKANYESAFTFIYSPRPGTPAAAMDCQVSDETKKERFQRLVKAVDEVVEANALEMVGNTYEVLVDGPSKKDPEFLSGYTESNKLVHFKGPSYLRGCLVKVRIDESKTYSLLGELVGDPLLYKAAYCADLLRRDVDASSYLAATESLKEDAGFREKLRKRSKAERDMALASGEEGHERAKEEFLALDKAIKEDPRYANREALLPSVEGLLREAEEILE